MSFLRAYPRRICACKRPLVEALQWHLLSPLAVAMVAGLVWNPDRMARLWMPCAALFGVYGVWRIVAA